MDQIIYGDVTIPGSEGTEQQHAWFEEALERSTYPWSRLTTTLVVRWVPVVLGSNSFAQSINTPVVMDGCGRTDNATVEFRDDLDDPNRTAGGAQYSGKPFYMETVVHELAHVLQFKLRDSHIATLVGLFGGAPWSGDPLWENNAQEMFAETFKDVFLPKPYRKFDNRTTRRLKRGDWPAFLDVIDDVCECRGVAT